MKLHPLCSLVPSLGEGVRPCEWHCAPHDPAAHHPLPCPTPGLGGRAAWGEPVVGGRQNWRALDVMGQRPPPANDMRDSFCKGEPCPGEGTQPASLSASPRGLGHCWAQGNGTPYKVLRA